MHLTARYTLICKDFGLHISKISWVPMAFHGVDHIRAQIVFDGTVLEQVSNFEYLGYNVPNITNTTVVKKLNMCGTLG